MSYLPNESATGIGFCSTMFWPIANSGASVNTTHWRRPQLTLTAMTIQRRSESNYAKRAALWRRAAGAQINPPDTSIETLCDDLDAFRESLAAAADMVGSNDELACSTALTAAKELVEGVAYAAACRPYGDEDRLAPEPAPEHWDRYMAGLLPDLLAKFATIPAAGDPVELPVL